MLEKKLKYRSIEKNEKIGLPRKFREDNPELMAKPSVSNLSPIVFAKMVKDSSITRKIFEAINKIFSQTIKKIFDPGTTWKNK